MALSSTTPKYCEFFEKKYFGEIRLSVKKSEMNRIDALLADPMGDHRYRRIREFVESRI